MRQYFTHLIAKVSPFLTPEFLIGDSFNGIQKPLRELFRPDVRVSKYKTSQAHYVPFFTSINPPLRELYRLWTLLSSDQTREQ